MRKFKYILVAAFMLLIPFTAQANSTQVELTSAPPAPTGITVDPNNGQPIVSWNDDEVAEWFVVAFQDQNTQELVYSEWLADPNGSWATTYPEYTQNISCDGITCTYSYPSTLPGSSYKVGVVSWNEVGYSTGGVSLFGVEGWAVAGFLAPYFTANEAISGVSASTVNGQTVLTWDGPEWAENYTLIVYDYSGVTYNEFYDEYVSGYPNIHVNEASATPEEVGCTPLGACEFVVDDATLVPGEYQFVIMVRGAAENADVEVTVIVP